jgi:hypothetical protein
MREPDNEALNLSLIKLASIPAAVLGGVTCFTAAISESNTRWTINLPARHTGKQLHRYINPLNKKSL